MTGPGGRSNVTGGSLSPGRRMLGYGLGSVIAAVTSVAAFTVTYDWGHAGTVWASAAGFVGGAIPNYVLNRRWAWPDRVSHDRRREATRYAVVSLASFATSAVVTHYAQAAASHLTDDHGWKVAFVAAAFLAVSGAFFVAKFVLYHHLVFTGPGWPAATAPRPGGRSAGPSPAPPTRSSPPPDRTATRT